MDCQSAKEIMKKVERDYDAMADDWNKTRAVLAGYKKKLAGQVKPGQKVLDAGCGNGALYDFLTVKSIEYTGLDISRRLLKIAEKRMKTAVAAGKKVKLARGNVLKMPFPDNYFDRVFVFAVLHHLPGEENRQTAVKEIRRVLKPGGRAAASVWNLFSDYAERKYGISRQFKKPPAGWDRGDVMVPWKASPEKKIRRYLRAFSKKEFVRLFAQAGFREIKFCYMTGKGKTNNKKKAFDLLIVGKKAAF